MTTPITIKLESIENVKGNIPCLPFKCPKCKGKLGYNNFRGDTSLCK